MRSVLLFILLATGCGSAPPDTVGDYCLDVAPILCDVNESCFGERDPSCVDEFVAFCCGDDGACAEPTRDIARRDYNRCLNDLEDRTCAQWNNEDALPASCQTL